MSHATEFILALQPCVHPGHRLVVSYNIYTVTCTLPLTSLALSWRYYEQDRDEKHSLVF